MSSFHHADIRQCVNPLSDLRLEERTRHRDEREIGLELDAPLTAVVPGELPPAANNDPTSFTKLLQQAWKQRVYDSLASEKQGMRMSALGNAFAWLEQIIPHVALDERDLVKMVGKDTRREKTGNAATNNDRTTEDTNFQRQYAPRNVNHVTRSISPRSPFDDDAAFGNDLCSLKIVTCGAGNRTASRSNSSPQGGNLAAFLMVSNGRARRGS